MTLPSAPRAIVLGWLARLLTGAGGLCLGLAVLGWGEAVVAQRVFDARLDRELREGAAAAAPSRTAAGVAAPVNPAAAPRHSPDAAPEPEDAIIGRLLAPRLNLRVVVAEGVSSRTLRRAVGHIPGTALPWEDGNVGLAGHRDTFFWPLRDVQVGDTFSLVTPRGRFEYVVRSLDVVGPEQADVLRPSDTPTLTLVTCYPFSMVGRAPSRLVVKAERVAAGLL